MSEKAKLIAEMLEMQKMFQDYEHKNGVDSAEYFAAKEGHPLFGYAQKYQDLANKVDAMAHEDKGSTRWFKSH
ncbi:MAG: hypothetical protein OQK75_00220 [Gammaproteobacteria bacterium]|nr:hypothetical protein [Gammaproteobacteria bacterium]MCW8986068.1 hypothetical protein [Gammaproteobacteria bacterium]MCW9032329.1 hypothetical protein [Gammaproteobacteria bacterium]